jgi:hypothetical protein
MNAVAMCGLAYILMQTVRKEDLEKPEYKDNPPTYTPRQIAYGSFCVGFGIFVLVAINYYSKKYVIEFGALGDKSNTIFRVVTPKPFHGYRERYYQMGDIGTKSLNLLQQPDLVGTKRGGDYIYIQSREKRGNMLMDLTTDHSYLDVPNSLIYFTQTNKISDETPNRKQGWTPVKKYKN